MDGVGRGRALGYPFVSRSALEPPAEWAELRRECPAARVRLPSGDEAVLLTRYWDVRTVLADPRFTRQLDAGDAARVTANESAGAFGDTRRTSTGDRHVRWRRMVISSFTPKRMAAMRPRIIERAERLVDGMVASGAPADLVADFGFPLPVWVICELLGVPDADRGRFAHWSDTMLDLSRFSTEEIASAQAEFVEYLAGHIAGKRVNPGDDLLSELAAIADSADGRMSERELVSTAQGLLVAGHETTANMIGKMIALLLTERSRWEQLLANRALVTPAVEETLRYDANPGFGMPRYLSDDVEVAGVVLPRGTTVVCSMGSANHDEEAIEHAEVMDLERPNNAHLAFGVGSHACIGQALARTELQVTLEVLLRRLPDLRLAVPSEELRRREGQLVGGLVTVPVRW